MRKKIKTLYLHIGGMKTGSTSIQEIIYGQRLEFIENGIYYPEIIPIEHCATFPLVCIKKPERFAPIVMNYNFNNKEEMDNYVNGIKQSWIDEFNKCTVDKFIISDELLSMRIQYNELDLVELKEFLYTYFEEVKIICYVRDSYDLMNSVLQQRIKGGINRFDINNIKARINPMLYKKFMPVYVDLFGKENVIVKKFDSKAYYKSSLIKDFLNIVDPEKSFDFVIDKRSNESLGNNAIAFLKYYTDAYPKMEKGVRNTSRALDMVDISLFMSEKDSKFAPTINFSVEEAKELNESILCINEFLDDEYKIDLVEGNDEPSKMFDKSEISIDFLREVSYAYFKRLGSINIYFDNILLYSEYYENIENEKNVDFFIKLVNEVQNQINIINQLNGKIVDKNNDLEIANLGYKVELEPSVLKRILFYIIFDFDTFKTKVKNVLKR